MREFFFLFLVILAGTGGELCVTRAMKVIGEVHDFRPAALVRFVFRAMRVGWMWIGIGMMTVAFFSLLAMLSIENVSLVVPVTALSYAAGAWHCSSCTNALAAALDCCANRLRGYARLAEQTLCCLSGMPTLWFIGFRFLRIHLFAVPI